MKFLFLTLVICLVGCAKKSDDMCGCAKKPVDKSNEATITRAAWNQRALLAENMTLSHGCNLHEGESFTDGGKACRKWLAEEQTNRSELSDMAWENFQKDIPSFPKPEDIIIVQLDKTADYSRVWVVTLVSADGRKMSYWLDSGEQNGGKVRFITSY
jgi:hypothetical protein